MEWSTGVPAFIHLPLAQILAWLVAYKYLLLFPVLVFEGPIVTVLAGLLVALGQLDLFWCYVVAVTADLVGDSLYYLAGMHGTRVRTLRRWLRLDRAAPLLASLRDRFDAHPGKTLVTAKLTHGIGGLALVAAGAAGMRFDVFLWWNAVGTLVKSGALLLLGYFFGHAYASIDAWLGRFALATIAIALLAAFAVLAWRARRSRTQPT